MRHAVGRSIIAVLAVFALASDHASAGPIIYNIVNYQADQDGATLSGFIMTDGTIGDITASNILSWSWTVSPSGGGSYTLTSSDPGTLADMGGPITASLTDISEPDTVPGQPENFFALLGTQRGFNGDLEYDHETGDNIYLANAPSTIWVNENPVLNGGEPWIIATAASVPEPSTLTLLGIAAVCIAGYARWRTGAETRTQLVCGVKGRC
jgi:hypothetical protein